MTHIRIYVHALLLVALARLPAQAEAPDWTNRYNAIKAQIISSNPPPQIGQTVSIMRTVGGGLTGQIEKVSVTQVVIRGRSFAPRELTEKSRKQVFPVASAIFEAKRRVLVEQADYQRERKQALAAAALQPAPAAPAKAPETVHQVAVTEAPAVEPVIPEAPEPATTQTVAAAGAPAWRFFADRATRGSAFLLLGAVIVVGGVGAAARRRSKEREAASTSTEVNASPAPQIRLRKKTNTPRSMGS